MKIYAWFGEFPAMLRSQLEKALTHFYQSTTLSNVHYHGYHFETTRHHAETIARKCSLKKLYFEIALDKPLCQSLFFNKVAGRGLQLY